MADFVFSFRATCLKIRDLSEAEKLDRFVHAHCSVYPATGGVARPPELP